jgi:predicted DNA repair protein MutK
MPSGLFALLDDVATITKMAAASIDDIGAAAAKAGTKAAGVVVDDTAVTPRYLVGFDPDRELPIIWKIAKGSLKNKLLFILPAALLLSALLPWAITPILMLGGAYLCFEGAEKIVSSLSEPEESLNEEIEELLDKDHEAEMISGAVRTDFILSAEIMAIALAEVAALDFAMRAASLVLVAIAITVGVYGVVALIVKMDDIGLHMAQKKLSSTRAIGRFLVHIMPKLLSALAFIGTAAMLWVGGQIVLHGLAEFKLGAPYYALHQLAETAAAALPLGGFVEWLINAAGAGVFGLALGGIIVAVHHRFAH